MISKFLDFDPFSGITQVFHYEPETDTTRIENIYPDLNDFMDACAEERNRPEVTRQGMKDGWLKVASIPIALIEQWMIEKGVNAFDPNDMPKVLSLLHDEYSRFKTTDMKHLKR
jgi:hypothetical protein